MIRSFKDRDTQKLFERKHVRKFPPEIHRRAKRKLNVIDAASTLEDLNASPGNRLERLTGNRTGQWSIRVNDQWRICFNWQNGDALHVELTDYH